MTRAVNYLQCIAYTNMLVRQLNFDADIMHVYARLAQKWREAQQAA